MKVGSAPVEPPDHGGVDGLDLVGLRRSSPDLRLVGAHWDMPVLLGSHELPDGGDLSKRELMRRDSGTRWAVIQFTLLFAIPGMIPGFGQPYDPQQRSRGQGRARALDGTQQQAFAFSFSCLVGGNAEVEPSGNGTPNSKNIFSNPAGATEISIFAGCFPSFLNECATPTGMLANTPLQDDSSVHASSGSMGIVLLTPP